MVSVVIVKCTFQLVLYLNIQLRVWLHILQPEAQLCVDVEPHFPSGAISLQLQVGLLSPFLSCWLQVLSPGKIKQDPNNFHHKINSLTLYIYVNSTNTSMGCCCFLQKITYDIKLCATEYYTFDSKSSLLKKTKHSSHILKQFFV